MTALNANAVYGPGGLIASENRTFNAFGPPRWQIFGAATGCTVSAAPATAQNLQPNGYDLALSFGDCPSAAVTSLTLAWNELKLDGTPKNCIQHQEGDIQDQDDENERQEFTNAGIAAHHCGIIHIDPTTGTALLQKLKYAKTYSFVLTAHADLGLYGTRDFVVKSFTVKLARNTIATGLVYTDTTPTPPPPSTIGVTGPGGRDVRYYQKDHLGTIRIVSDEAGNVLSTHDYEPFGLELPGVDFSDNTHRFTGHERDTETNLDYMKARYYGASMGRFTSFDVNGYEIDKLLFPTRLNRYEYSNNNPLYYYDRDGKKNTVYIDQAFFWGINFSFDDVKAKPNGYTLNVTDTANKVEITSHLQTAEKTDIYIYLGHSGEKDKNVVGLRPTEYVFWNESLSKDEIAKALKDSNAPSVVVLAACSSASLSQTFIQGGVKAVFSFAEDIASGKAAQAATVIANALVAGKSLEEARQEAEAAIHAPDTIKLEVAPDIDITKNLEQNGLKDISK